MRSKLCQSPAPQMPFGQKPIDEPLARWLAHELRNPLAPIATAADLLLDPHGDAKARQLGQIISRQVRRLRQMIDQLVDGDDMALSGLASGASRPVDSVTLIGSPLRILVVDDNADAATLLGEFLQNLGHEVRVVTDPLAAVAVATCFEPQIALLDIIMPGMGGPELARRLRHLPFAASLRLAAVTACSQFDDDQSVEQAGFERRFVKPLDVNSLVDWLAQPVPLSLA